MNLLLTNEVPNITLSNKKPVYGLHPNPTSDVITMKMEGGIEQSAIIRIYNLQGQLMVERQVDNLLSESLQFDVSSYPGGIYHMVLLVEGRTPTTNRFVVNKK